jgi:phospholipase C
LPTLPSQRRGTRPSRPLPYELEAACTATRDTAGLASLHLQFENSGAAGAVFHVYDRLALERIPLRFTVEAGKRLSGSGGVAADGRYDLWLLGPNGFHRHFTGAVGSEPGGPEIRVACDRSAGALRITLRNDGAAACIFRLAANAYLAADPTRHEVAAATETLVVLPLSASKGWYDFSATLEPQPAYSRRFAGRLETGAPSISDPEMHGMAIGTQYQPR